MNYTIEKSDQYSLIKTDIIALDKNTASKLIEKVRHEVASSSKYVIVNISGVKECNADATRELISLGLELRENDGLLIITEAEDPFTRLFTKADITFIPTDVEAVDFVFMDQLEKQFLNMGDDAETK
jgi:anti-anti-sigma regulatory factor